MIITFLQCLFRLCLLSELLALQLCAAAIQRDTDSSGQSLRRALNSSQPSAGLRARYRHVYAVSDVDLSDGLYSRTYEDEIYGVHTFIAVDDGFGMASRAPTLRIELLSPINDQSSQSKLALAVTDLSRLSAYERRLGWTGFGDTSRQMDKMGQTRLSNQEFFNPAGGMSLVALMWYHNRMSQVEAARIWTNTNTDDATWTSSQTFAYALLAQIFPNSLRRPGWSTPIARGMEWASIKRRLFPSIQQPQPIQRLFYDTLNPSRPGVRRMIDRRVYELTHTGTSKVIRQVSHMEIRQPKPHERDYLSRDAELTSDAYFFGSTIPASQPDGIEPVPAANMTTETTGRSSPVKRRASLPTHWPSF